MHGRVIEGSCISVQVAEASRKGRSEGPKFSARRSPLPPSPLAARLKRKFGQASPGSPTSIRTAEGPDSSPQNPPSNVNTGSLLGHYEFFHTARGKSTVAYAGPLLLPPCSSAGPANRFPASSSATAPAGQRTFSSNAIPPPRFNGTPPLAYTTANAGSQPQPMEVALKPADYLDGLAGISLKDSEDIEAPHPDAGGIEAVQTMKEADKLRLCHVSISDNELIQSNCGGVRAVVQDAAAKQKALRRIRPTRIPTSAGTTWPGRTYRGQITMEQVLKDFRRFLKRQSRQ